MLTILVMYLWMMKKEILIGPATATYQIDFESSDEEESNEAVEKQQIVYDQEVTGERSEKVNVEVEEQQEEKSATVAEHETMVLP